MSRRKIAEKRKILPDPVYHSELLAKFINCMMKNGKKPVAEKIIYDALEEAFKRLGNKAQQQQKERLKETKESGEEEGGDDGDGGIDENIRVLLTPEQALSLEIFHQALENIRPSVEVRSRRVGGATYQIPVEVHVDRSFALAMRWIIDGARGRSEHGMKLRLAVEICDAYEGRGSAIKKRDDVHRMAEANKAFAHFRW